MADESATHWCFTNCQLFLYNLLRTFKHTAWGGEIQLSKLSVYVVDSPLLSNQRWNSEQKFPFATFQSINLCLTVFIRTALSYHFL